MPKFGLLVILCHSSKSNFRIFTRLKTYLILNFIILEALGPAGTIQHSPLITTTIAWHQLLTPPHALFFFSQVLSLSFFNIIFMSPLLSNSHAILLFEFLTSLFTSFIFSVIYFFFNMRKIRISVRIWKFSLAGFILAN
ncbi:unnamed protein product [Vicia faba]|uniref:Uncharacterized protein n=1 Tax=Vicia faba TaxID=3906 RepID=A0AAV0Z790_VICFA|nr:unnamed protein product [Vicia faba]